MLASDWQQARSILNAINVLHDTNIHILAIDLYGIPFASAAMAMLS